MVSVLKRRVRAKSVEKVSERIHEGSFPDEAFVFTLVSVCWACVRMEVVGIPRRGVTEYEFRHPILLTCSASRATLCIDVFGVLGIIVFTAFGGRCVAEARLRVAGASVVIHVATGIPLYSSSRP